MPKSSRSLILVSLFSASCVAGAGFRAGGSSTVSTAPPPSGDVGDGEVIAYDEQGAQPAKAGAQTRLDDFSFGLKEYSGSWSRTWILNKLTTFKVGSACWAKMIDTKQSALHSASFYTAAIEDYAEKVTGDDWSDVESKSKKHLEPMIDAFRARFNVTIEIEGDDCDASHGSLWMRYWFTIGEAIRDYPTSSGKAFIRLSLTNSVKDITVKIDDAGTTFEFVAPLELEPKSWDDKLTKPFRRLAAEKE